MPDTSTHLTGHSAPSQHFQFVIGIKGKHYLIKYTQKTLAETGLTHDQIPTLFNTLKGTLLKIFELTDRSWDTPILVFQIDGQNWTITSESQDDFLETFETLQTCIQQLDEKQKTRSRNRSDRIEHSLKTKLFSSLQNLIKVWEEKVLTNKQKHHSERRP